MSAMDTARLQVHMRRKYAKHIGKQPNGLGDDEVMGALEAKAREFEVWRYEVYADDLYRQFSQIVPRGARILEIGASCGKLLVPWRDRHGCEITGVDPRKATVLAAKEHLGIDLIEGFPATAPIAENSVDISRG